MKKRLISVALCLTLLLTLLPLSVFAHTCVDADRDYWCDDCGFQIYHKCYDPDRDGWCNLCSCWIFHTCADSDGDHKCELCSQYLNINIHITVHSQVNEIADHVSLFFYPREPDTLSYSVTGNPAKHTINYFAKSYFRLLVTKYGHAPRTFNYDTDTADIYIETTLYRYGDATQDGKVNVGDTAKIYGHVKGTGYLTDAYAIECADINTDRELNIGDVARVYSHIRQTKLLW